MIGHTLRRDYSVFNSWNWKLRLSETDAPAPKARDPYFTLWDNKEIQHDFGGARLNKLLTAAYVQLENKIAWK